MSDPEGLICCFSCLSVFPCIRNALVRKIAFRPPAKSGYSVSQDGQFRHLNSYGTYTAPSPVPGLSWELIELEDGWGQTINALYIQNASNVTGMTVMHFHGNSTDIGYSFAQMRAYAQEIGCNVIQLEYPGYGMCNGTPGEGSITKAARSLYDYLVQTCRIPSGRIVLHGVSIGSVCACDLASRVPVAGVILQSGLRSGLSLVRKDANHDSCADIFRNAHKLSSVNCPVFVIHGKLDQQITVRHGQGLYEAAPNKYPAWWVPDAGHNDIEMKHRHMFATKVKEFLVFVGGGGGGGFVASGVFSALSRSTPAAFFGGGGGLNYSHASLGGNQALAKSAYAPLVPYGGAQQPMAQSGLAYSQGGGLWGG
uniref:Serine aminopeptidase S33 domain-containing protein n=1 Tax=Chromera velia CCMP2878 TaxID=1169474 RepID=A0A0G4HSY5_9ALVE|eukprot:Cvel_8331.t1-p1 / transcript=Cvel_8331.t1 / gene=Cvel_8331 / organism=Chromera_velia_CCMP2878 / gene_product=Alpha/beta hydrolase domain-containing protein 17C, putative / transcript_product=Alpha/beta hydrolase domain-containing protein 17C, putative / location=Cvel_scaffold458:44719-51146(+) / protein_length=366 / sequence_SO=supercontig / SO=protein_coding / is_pseudo=false